MLYLLAEYLGFPGVFNLIRYLSFRSGAAVATALVIGLLIGPRVISMLRVRQGKAFMDGPEKRLCLGLFIGDRWFWYRWIPRRL